MSGGGGSGVASGRGRRPQRPGRKGGGRAKQLDQIAASSYNDAEEALDAGIQLEEKAERFAIGDKAKKFYTLSFEVYNRALQLRREDANASYNAARVAFLLATQFNVPPASIKKLQESVQAYEFALSLVQATAEDDLTPNAFFLDIKFNLAIAQLAFAEHLIFVGDATSQVQNLLESSIAHLQQVLQGQMSVLQGIIEQEQQNASAEIERPTLFEQAEHSGSDNSIGDEDGSTEVSNANAQEDYTSSLVTPASALETIASLHNAAMVLIENAIHATNAQYAVSVSQQTAGLVRQLVNMFPDGDRRSPEDDWAEQLAILAFAPLEVNIALLPKMIDAFEERALTYVKLAEDILSNFEAIKDGSHVVDTPRIRSQKVERLADLSLSAVRLGVRFAHDQTGWPALNMSDRAVFLQKVWQVCTQGAKMLLFALELINTGDEGSFALSTVLGDQKSAINNPTARRKSSLYNRLSVAAALRCFPCFYGSTLLDDSLAADRAKSRASLLDNARIYARKALAEIGLTWILQQSPQQFHSYFLPFGGLEAVEQDAEAVLALLRVFSLRFEYCEGQEKEKAVQESAIFCANIAHCIRSANEASPVWRTCLGLSNDENVFAGQNLLEAALDVDDGDGSDTGSESFALTILRDNASQREFWSSVQQALSV